MENSSVFPNIRIRRIVLHDFRNIVHAEVDLPAGKMIDYTSGEPSILGLYGQNGSGKTSLLLAIRALKDAMSGNQLVYPVYSSCIRSGCESTRLEFEFSAYNDADIEFDIYYSFSLCIADNDDRIKAKTTIIDNDIFMDSDTDLSSILDEYLDGIGYGNIITQEAKDVLSDYFIPQNKRIKIFDEVLQFAAKSSDTEKMNKQVIIDTSEKACKSSGKSFGNKTKYSQLTYNCEPDIDDYLNKAKIEADIKSESFIFSVKVVNTLIKGSNKLSYKLLLRSLRIYALDYLFVLLTSDTAANNPILLPLYYWINDEEKGAIGGCYNIPLSGQCSYPEQDYYYIEKQIKSVAKVVSQIVPGLSIEINDIGESLSKNGKKIHLFELLSVRDNVRIPIVYESDGIRRLITFISLMVAAYNNPSVTVAIDEIESGIFEYMLGEILSIMKESAKGQLIFTSHNLRPLEVLPYKNLLFTTVNPENRFTKLEGISGNNNLRDSYFRSIILGSGKDAYYNATDTFNIEQALFESGLSEEE